MTRLRLAFMGAPDFALPTLQALLDRGYTLCTVYSQPARPAGRKQVLRDTPVGATAKALGLSLHTPESLKTAKTLDAFRALDLDAAIVVAYGLLLPKDILTAPRLGCINLHASLLPRWRGAAPIQRAIQAGDRESGVTVMQMEKGLDTGPVLAQARVAITEKTTGQSLHDALARRGAALLVETLDALAIGEIEAQPQPSAGVSYAQKLRRVESALDWSRPAEALERQIRAFSPWPGSHCTFDGTRLKVLSADLANGEGEAGTVLDDRLRVACGSGALQLTALQRPGKAALETEAFLRGFPIGEGSRLT
ncbi:MAG: methionyl-tRNA formyltransferase [Rhodospirillales bacterium]|nr:methionyl-tRNA formyltransferase [Rhodospirillales bacterium]